MDKFWEWMVKKGYAKKINSKLYGDFYVIIGKNKENYINVNHQMLIGYMYKYIEELCEKIIIKKEWDKIEESMQGDIIRQQLPIMEIEKAWYKENHYETLVNIIKILEELNE